MPATGASMDLFSFIAAMTGHLSWPVAVVALGWGFRKQVSSLLGKLEAIGFGGAEAKFKQTLDRAEAAAVKLPGEHEAIAPPAPEPPPEERLPVAAALEETEEEENARESEARRIWKDKPAGLDLLPSLANFESIAMLSPSAAIIDAAQDIERAVRRLGDKYGVPKALPKSRLYMSLALKGALSSSLMELLKSLDTLRDQAAHRGENLTISDAIRYRENALVAARNLANLLAT